MNQPDAPQSPEFPKPVKLRRRRRQSGSNILVRLNRKMIRRVNWTVVLLTFSLMIAVIVVMGLILVSDANKRINSSLASLNLVVDAIQNKPATELTLADIDLLQASANNLSNNLSAARRQLNFLAPLSPFSSNITTSRQALDAAQELALAADEMLTGLQPTVFFLVSGEDNETIVARISSGQRVVELLRLGRGRFLEAENHLNAAASQLEAMEFATISADLLLQVEDLSKAHEQLKDVNTILLNGPELLSAALGLSNSQSYLVLAQNNDEIRPSGGYISTYGWMSVRNGRISEFDYRASIEGSIRPPNAEVANEFTIPDWWIQYQDPIFAAWDGSWYADFPSTAELAAWFYDKGNNPLSPVDAVLAIDVVGFEYILEALGGVVIPERNEVVTIDNFRDVVYDIRAFERSPDDMFPHKSFVADVYRQIFDNWQAIDRNDLRRTEVLSATLRALQEKHILLYFKDERLNEAVGLLGWSGAQTTATDHDYLMVADANIAGNKLGRSIIRDITYDVEVQSNGSLQSRATVSYDYSAQLALEDPGVNPPFHGPLDYRTLFQVFVPTDSVITETDNLQMPIENIATGTHNIFVSRARINYDTTERLQFFYTTPPLIEQIGQFQRYRLLLQMQAGVILDTVNVQIVLPDDARIVNISPEPAAIYELDRPVMEFRFDLVADQWIEVIYN